jgi:hypothetical protein
MSMCNTSRHAWGGTVIDRRHGLRERVRRRLTAGRTGVRTAIVASVFLTLLVPVNADASSVPASQRTAPAERSGAVRTSDMRRTPYIRNTNRFHVVCCINFVEPYTVDWCPDNFNLIQTARLGVSDARGDWVKVHWIKLRSYGHHRNRLNEFLLIGADGGVNRFTPGPKYKPRATRYKRIRAFPNPTNVKYNGNWIVLDLSGKYAPNVQTAPSLCHVYGDSSKIFIHR